MKKILSLAIVCALTASTAAFAENFREADYLVEKGYLHGTGNGLETERNATNAEALAMLYRIAGKETGSARSAGHWADAIIEDARENGYIEYSEESVTLRGTLAVEDGVLLLTNEDGVTYELKDCETVVFAGDNDGAVLAEALENLDGKYAEAVVSPVMTRSIPAQTNAYYILAEENGKMAKFFEIGETGLEDGNITALSADGEYKIALEPMANVTPYLTKNIMKAQDLKKGDKLLVYSDIATMSIPALLQAEKVVYLTGAEEFVPDSEAEISAFTEMAARILTADELPELNGELLSRADMIKFCYDVVAK